MQNITNSRVIKFRVWDIRNKNWVSVFEKSFLNNPEYIVQQFTGLKDKEGKEIYEGDIIQVANNRIYQVKFIDGGEVNREWYGGIFALWLNEEVFFPLTNMPCKTV